MNFKKTLVLVFISLLFLACESKSQNEGHNNSAFEENDSSNIQNETCKEFTRENILKRLEFKKSNKIPLIVHIFVPLCDNEHQGIIPVNKSLGDGQNLKTNLYWGAGYGIKTHFKRKKNWELIQSKLNLDENILERLVFRKTYNSNTQVILIADAYAGDKMIACMQGFFNALAGLDTDTLFLQNDTVPLKSNTDLLIFNGHNGLMDNYLDTINNADSKEKDAAVISCLSFDFFMERLKCLKAYPLITTRDYLPPEAYVAEGIIDAWAELKTTEEIRLSAGNAMFRVFKRDQKAMQGIFKTGW